MRTLALPLPVLFMPTNKSNFVSVCASGFMVGGCFLETLKSQSFILRRRLLSWPGLASSQLSRMLSWTFLDEKLSVQDFPLQLHSDESLGTECCLKVAAVEALLDEGPRPAM